MLLHILKSYLRDLLDAGQVRGVSHSDLQLRHAVVVGLLGHRVTAHVRAHHEPIGVIILLALKDHIKECAKS